MALGRRRPTPFGGAANNSCRTQVFASFGLAAGQTARAIKPPFRSRGELDLERLPLDLSLDDAGRIRRAIFHGNWS